LRQQLGQAGRDYVLTHHTWDKVVTQILAMATDPAAPEKP
jgi:hypothetical protein